MNPAEPFCYISATSIDGTIRRHSRPISNPSPAFADGIVRAPAILVRVSLPFQT